jgi:hypothetical protein
MRHLTIKDNGDVFNDVLDQTHQFFIDTRDYPASIGINQHQRFQALADRRNICTIDGIQLKTLLGFPVIVRPE